MLVDRDERFAILNYAPAECGFYSYPLETRNVARILDLVSGTVKEIRLRDERTCQKPDAQVETLAVVRHLGKKAAEVTARVMTSPGQWISKLVVSDAGSSFEGEMETWKRLPRAYQACFTFHGDHYEYLLRLDLDRESVEVQRLDWYNENAYDMGYQGLLGVTEIPGSRLLIFPIQRDSQPVLYDPVRKQVVGKISLADRHGNPRIHFRRTAPEVWADDYDTLLRLSPNGWRIADQRRLQGGTKKLYRQFIGEFAFNKDESMCAVARPFRGDVLVLDTKRFEITHRADLGHQPLSVALLSDGRVFARDWQRPIVLRGEIQRVEGFDPLGPRQRGRHVSTA